MSDVPAEGGRYEADDCGVHGLGRVEYEIRDGQVVYANSGPVRIYTFLHDARPVLLNLGEPGRFAAAVPGDRVDVVDARYPGAWTLPVVGQVPRTPNAGPRTPDPSLRTPTASRASPGTP
ncbi:MAG TPA: hypothetical protein VK966_12715 [Longimicrobiales bacterium]|nr:hypothetical protein [Longimicrobiales bacterium]